MAYGALATISVAKPTNLDIFVLDNERYGETGMQTSHTGPGIDLASVAHASGFVDTAVLRRQSEIAALTSGQTGAPREVRGSTCSRSARRLSLGLFHHAMLC